MLSDMGNKFIIDKNTQADEMLDMSNPIIFARKKLKNV